MVSGKENLQTGGKMRSNCNEKGKDGTGKSRENIAEPRVKGVKERAGGMGNARYRGCS